MNDDKFQRLKEKMFQTIGQYQQYFLTEERTLEVFVDFFEMYIVDSLGSIMFCESPIEKIMFIELKRILPDNFDFTPQVEVGDYRVDFMIKVFDDSEEIFTAVVECDGHDFHEKTKKQAQKDKSRDRDLYRYDIDLVLHFTGSEIYNNPTECAEDVYGTIKNKIAKNRSGD